MLVNINNQCSFTLTADGAAIWNARYDGLPLPANLRPAPVEAGATVRAQLWAVMQTFGPHIRLGMREAPFLDATMEIEPNENR